MPLHDYDLVIIGGGPGGSTAAATARQHGLRTLVVEKTAFPRFHIGESLLPAGNATLRATGVWPKIAAAGFIPKFGAEFHRSSGVAPKVIAFGDSLVPGLESAFQVERARFDTILLEHAQSLGAEVRQRTTATAIVSDDAGHRVTLASAAGEQSVTAPWLIDTTGRDPGLRSPQKNALDPSPFPKRIALFNHFHGVVRAPGPDGGNILVVRHDGGWFWIIPIDATRTSVGVVTTVEIFRAANLPPPDFFARAVAASPKVRELLAAASPTMEFQVTSDYSYFRRELAAERLLLAGDAAGFFDPVFSSGVYMATWTGRLAASLVARAHAAGRPLTPRERRRYTRDIKRHAAVFQKLIAAFYDDDAFDVFMCEPVPWDLQRGLNSIVAGCADLSWPLWWRYHVFLAVCRLQRRWKLVKPPAPPAAN
jgi:flavin-dependent dehydrogenase